MRPCNNANTTAPRCGTVAVSQAQVSESFVTEEHIDDRKLFVNEDIYVVLV